MREDWEGIITTSSAHGEHLFLGVLVSLAGICLGVIIEKCLKLKHPEKW